MLHRAVREEVDAVVHTGDIFDHDVDRATLDSAISELDALADEGIPFYFVLGDHDRLATGGETPAASDAMRALETTTCSEMVTHCRPTGQPLADSRITIFGVDATNIGFAEIRNGYTLNGWIPEDLDFDVKRAGETNALCLHEPVEGLSFPDILENLRRRNLPFDLVLLGHEHRPGFDGEWTTEIDGVTISCAGPAIPISSYFDDYRPGHNRIRVGSSGGISVDRREL